MTDKKPFKKGFIQNAELKMFKSEMEHLKKTHIPRCLKCKENFFMESPNYWVPMCKCYGKKKIAICMG